MKWIRWIDTMVAVGIVALVLVARMPGGGPGLAWANSGNVLSSGALCGNTTCGEGFAGSYHDFITGPGSAYNLGYVNNGTTPVGQCTMCHTPHEAIMTALLWNHALSNNTSFQWEANAITMAGTVYKSIANNWTGPTAKCLSCHDGSVAVSTINWFNHATPSIGTPDCSLSGDGHYDNCPSYLKGSLLGIGGNMMGVHPVAFPYPCQGSGSSYNSMSSIGGQIVSDEWVSSPALPIRIYQMYNGSTVTRATPGSCQAGVSGIECSSCHDVHNRENVDAWLLRGYMAGSGPNYICNECHAK